MRTHHSLVALSAIALAAPAVIACGPGDDCSITLTCAPPATGGEGGTPSTGGTGGMSDGGSTTNTGGTGGGGTGGDGGVGGTPFAPGEVICEKSFGDDGNVVPTGAAFLSDGSVALAGRFDGSLNFGGGSLVASGVDVFVARLGAAAGGEEWANRYGGNGDQRADGVTVDGLDNIWLFGEFDAPSINFGAGALNAVDEADLFVVKLGSAGQALLSTRLGSAFVDHARGIQATSTNDVVVTGTFNTTIDIGTATLTGPSQVTSTFVAALSGGTAQHLWSRAVTTSADYGVGPEALATGPGGKVVFAAGADSSTGSAISMTYDGVTENWPSNANGATSGQLVIQAGASGAYGWHQPFNVANATDVSVLANGDVLACGTYTGNGNFPAAYMMPAAVGLDVWVARFSGSGAPQWSRRYGGPGIDGGYPQGMRCAALPDGSHLIAARSNGLFGIGATEIPGDSESIVIAAIDDDGNAIWTQRTTGVGDIASLTAEGNRAALVLKFAATVGLDVSHANVGGTDVYLAVLAL